MSDQSFLGQLCATAARSGERFEAGAVDESVVVVRLPPRSDDGARDAIRRAQERWPSVKFKVGWSM
jgi:hypothetical protein